MAKSWELVHASTRGVLRTTHPDMCTPACPKQHLRCTTGATSAGHSPNSISRELGPSPHVLTPPWLSQSRQTFESILHPFSHIRARVCGLLPSLHCPQGCAGAAQALRSTTQHCAALCSTMQHNAALCSSTQRYAALRSTTQHYAALRSTTQGGALAHHAATPASHIYALI
jgi:hypothetical protein